MGCKTPTQSRNQFYFHLRNLFRWRTDSPVARMRAFIIFVPCRSSCGFRHFMHGMNCSVVNVKTCIGFYCHIQLMYQSSCALSFYIHLVYPSLGTSWFVKTRSIIEKFVFEVPLLPKLCAQLSPVSVCCRTFYSWLCTRAARTFVEPTLGHLFWLVRICMIRNQNIIRHKYLWQ